MGACISHSRQATVKFMVNYKFSIQLAYNMLWPHRQKTQWRSIMPDNRATGRSKFIVWMLTQDRLAKWGIPAKFLCPLCILEHETHQLLFKDCQWTAELRKQVLGKFNCREGDGLYDEVVRVGELCKKKKNFGYCGMNTYIKQGSNLTKLYINKNSHRWRKLEGQLSSKQQCYARKNLYVSYQIECIRDG